MSKELRFKVSNELYEETIQHIKIKKRAGNEMFRSALSSFLRDCLTAALDRHPLSAKQIEKASHEKE